MMIWAKIWRGQVNRRLSGSHGDDLSPALLDLQPKTQGVTQ